MSDKFNNYIEETKPLFRLLRTEAFRFIIVRYNHYSLVSRLKEDLFRIFPERPQNTIDARNTDYRLLVDSYYKAEKGFFFIENFDEILANPEIYTGLNQRRDKLALTPIALIVFISSSTEELFARQIMEKMPDLWSFRSLLLDLKVEASQMVQIENSNQSFVSDQVTITTTTTLGGSTIEEKELELDRLLKRVSEISEKELLLLKTAYEQIAKLYEDLYKHDEAIKYLSKLEDIQTGIGDKSGLGTTYNDLGFIYSQKGELNMSLEFYKKSLEIRFELNDKVALGTTYNNLGGTYNENGNSEEALSYYQKAEQMFLSTGYKHGLGITYFNIGFVYSKLNYWEESLEYLVKSEKVLTEVGDQKKRSELQKIIGNVYNSMGLAYSNKGDFNNAITYHHQAEKIRYEMGDDSGLVQTLYNIGMEWLRIKNAEKAVDYFILAGFIAKKKGLDFELKQMDWAIREIIKKHGESNFMEIGENHYKSWLQHAELEKKSSK